ncbi:type 1 glutamine amidotransferase domain-containing protein [Sutterella seckii]|uniref:Type 1 glutamine amidotransferase domain-containing protein n=2 Tax=Sutterella seckii TaxID=1944635 RepID=A0A6I1ENE7_9BURK|nr:type 1 glutamine amidotransferase domain-containing protein [Sutterella seckii]
MMNTVSILIIATAHALLGGTGAQTGLWLEELTTPYYAFADQGASITIATLPGGRIPIDPHSLAAAGKNPPTVERYLKDADLQSKLKESRRLEDLAYKDYEAIFIPGGHGAMWDLASSEVLGKFLSDAWKGGAVIGSVCHGPAAFSLAVREDGRALVSGLHVTGFSNSEEEKMKLTRVVPFLLETRMREAGGIYAQGPDFEAFAVRDGRLVTGQNPASSQKVAELMLEALK